MSCMCRKAIYTSERGAQSALRRSESYARGPRPQVYRCPGDPRLWHIGKRRLKAIEARQLDRVLAGKPEDPTPDEPEPEHPGPVGPPPHRAFMPSCGRACPRCSSTCVLAGGHQVAHHCGNGHSW